MSWPLVPLGELGTWIGGATPSKSNPLYWDEGTIPWLSPKDMGREVLAKTQDHITEAAVEASSVRLVPANSVAVVVRSGILERILPVAVVPFETTLNQDMKALVPDASVAASWVAWAIRGAERDLLQSTRKAGTTVASIETARLMAWKIPVPPTEEQRRVVAVLEDHLSRIDAGARGVERSSTLARAWLSSTVASALDVPQHELQQVGDLLTSARGGWSRARSHLVAAPEGVPYLKMNNIRAGGGLDLTHVVRVRTTSAELETFKVVAGDILFNSKNSGDLVGKTAVATPEVEGFVFNENIMRLRFGPELRPEFVGWWFRGPAMRKHLRANTSASTNVAAVYQAQLRAAPIWVPSRKIQDRTMSHLSQVADTVSQTCRAVEMQTRRSRMLRRSLLAAAFDGCL